MIWKDYLHVYSTVPNNSAARLLIFKIVPNKMAYFDMHAY